MSMFRRSAGSPSGVLVVLLGGALFLARSNPASAQGIDAPAQSLPYLHSTKATPVTSPLPGDARVRHLVPEGKSVEEGELLCELQGIGSAKDVEEYTKAVELAETGLRDARTDREIAELGVKEFELGTAARERQVLQNRIAVAEARLKAAQQNLDVSRKVRERIRDAMGADNERRPEAIAALRDADRRVTADELEVQRSQFQITEGHTALDVLERFTVPKNTKALEAEAQRKRAIETARSRELDAARKQLQQAQDMGREVTIRAPHGGIVLYVPVGSVPTVRGGRMAQPGRPFVTIEDPSAPLRVTVSVPEKDLGPDRSVKDARVFPAQGEGGPFPALVGRIYSLDDPDHPSSWSRGKAWVDVVLKDVHPELKPGMKACVEVGPAQP